MRRLAILAVLACASLAAPQAHTWEKVIAPGLTYRSEFNLNVPISINVLRWSPGAGTMLGKPELGNGTVFGADGAGGREPLLDMLKRKSAVAGINADFFPWTGDPLGAMILDGELLSLPAANRSLFAWGPSHAEFGRLIFAGKAYGEGDAMLVLSGVNQECEEGRVVLNTPAAGSAMAKEPGTHLKLRLSDKIKPNGEVTAEVIEISANMKSIPVPPGEVVLTALGSSEAAMLRLAQGKTVRLVTNTRGMEMADITQAVSGGPALVRDGESVGEAQLEGFGEKFATDRHPRTAVGTAANGDVLLVTVDGRQEGISRGMSLPELSDLMRQLGCSDAINLDGGGSTTMAIHGIVVNRPSDPTPRPVSNALLLYSAAPMASANGAQTMVIRGRPFATPGTYNPYQVVDQDGMIVPNREILWHAHGDAWIDQGGRLRSLKDEGGSAVVRAAVRGQVLEVPVRIEAAQTPPPSLQIR